MARRSAWAALAALGALLALSGEAWAACPTMPADYTGADVVVDELRDARCDAVTTCGELALRLQTLNTNVQAVGVNTGSGVGGVNVTEATRALLDHFRDVFGTSYTGGTGNPARLVTGTYGGRTVGADTASIKSAVEPLHGDVDQVEPKLDQLHTDLSVGPVPTSGGGGGGTGTVELSATDRGLLGDVAAKVEGVRTWLHADLWFLVGLAVIAIPGYFLVRLVMPRA